MQVRGFAVMFFIWSVLASSALAELQISDAYVRAMPPGQPNTAAFMRIKNTAEVDVVISGAETAAAAQAEIHAHRHKNGMMSMYQVEQVTVPAGGEFELRPGGHHLMLMGLVKPLRVGDHITLQLVLENKDAVTVAIPVRSILHEHHH